MDSDGFRYLPRRRHAISRGPCVALIAATTFALAGAPAPVTAVAEPMSAPSVLKVCDINGKATELLHRLTIPQLAALLKTTPAQLSLEFEAAGGLVSVELHKLLANPKATLQEVLDVMAAHGFSSAPLAQLISRLLAGASESSEQLRETIDAVLADLREDGQIEQLAKELVLPSAVVEALHLVPSSAESLAGTLNTTTSNLASLLLGAGATTGPTPFVSSGVQTPAGGGTTVVVGSPTGGGLSLTVINSTPAASASSAASSSSIGNAFTIVSVSVTRAGVIRETVSLPGPGRLAINASTRRRVAVRSSSGHRRSSTRTATLASVGETLSSGVHTVTLHLRGSVSRIRPLAVKLATTYTPTGGSARTIERTVTLRRTRTTRHH